MHTMAFLPLFEPIAHGRREVLVFVFLDIAGRVLGLRHCPSDRPDTVDVPLREVAADALRLDARLAVMAHNHPSGDPEPTREDMATTRRIVAALDAVGVRVIDHLILSKAAFTSFRARGLL